MNFRTTLHTLSFVLLSTTAAFADPATPEGAARLLGVMQAYLGQTEGVVSVTPAGDTYAVALDLAPLAGLVPEAGATASMTPWALNLTDQGNGTWAVTQDQAFSAKVSVPGALEATVDVGSIKSAGVFDETLMAFSTWSMDMSDMKVNEVITQAEVGTQTVGYTVNSGHYESTATAAAVGVDQDMLYTFAGLEETISMPVSPDAAPLDIGVKVAQYQGEGHSKGMRPEAMYGLMAWFVAHPTGTQRVADQAGLKDVLSKGLPIFDNLVGTATMSDLTVTTPVGMFAAETAAATVDMNGIVADGKFREAISVAGLTMPDGLVPAWAIDLVPDSFALDFMASRFNLADPAALFIGAFDLAAPTPVDDATGAQMLAALLPDGVVDITLAPGNVTSGLYDLRFEGAMTAGPETEVPTGQAKVTLSGMTAIEAALNAAPPEVSGQILPMLGMAKGMAKAGDEGKLIWEVDATTPGTLVVNGVDLLGMGGQ